MEFAMKKMILTVLAVGFLAVLTGCATIQNSYLDDATTTLLPVGTIQWPSSSIDLSARVYARRNSNASEGAQFNHFYEEFTEQAQNNILLLAWSSQEELEQLGKKVTQNLNADVNPMYKRLEERLRALPSGTRLVFGGTNPTRHHAAAVAFLADDGSFEHYVVED
jgi:hypothetical protein